MKIRHIGIVVADMDFTAPFYEELFHAKRHYDKKEKVRIVKLEIGNGVALELLQYESMGESTLRKRGISHVAFTTDPEGNNLEIVDES